MFFSDSAAAGSVEDEVRYASSSSFALEGDFYGVQDDVCRGITFCPDTVPAPLGFDYDADVLKKGGFGADLAPPAPGFFMPDALNGPPPSILPQTPALRRFQAADVPPYLPSDEAFGLQATTVLVKGGENTTMPAEIGNTVLDFFKDQVAASITKVNHVKFTVKAEVQLDGFACEVKLRMYRMDELRGAAGLAIELQRRGGDRVAFNSLYRLLSQHLVTCGAAADSVVDTSTAVIPPLGYVAKGDLPENSLSPLLDTVEKAEDDTLRAEAASGLAAAARDLPQARAELCTTRALEAFQLLLCADSFNIVYPIACLLTCLAGQQELKRSFLNHPLRSTIFQKLQEQQTEPPVRAQLEQALRCAATQHAEALPRHVVDEVHFALASC